MEASIVSLARYPVKGLSGEPLHEASLTPGEGFVGDRILAFARHGTPFDEDAPTPLQKRAFHMLARDAALATLATRYDPATDTLTLSGATETTARLATADGIAAAENAIAAHLGHSADAAPRLVRGKGRHRFTDVSVVSDEFMQAVSIVNLATIADFAARTGHTITPERFRANIVVDGWPAWSELQLEGATINAGTARLRGLLRTERCAATTVNPLTAARDVPIPRLLTETVGHADLGLYVSVEGGGVLRPGDTLTVV
ncbi:MAG: MOSC domain-containing protein [Pseudomonadota bacterium]